MLSACHVKGGACIKRAYPMSPVVRVLCCSLVGAQGILSGTFAMLARPCERMDGSFGLALAIGSIYLLFTTGFYPSA